jgi:hypothetical protein
MCVCAWKGHCIGDATFEAHNSRVCVCVCVCVCVYVCVCMCVCMCVCVCLKVHCIGDATFEAHNSCKYACVCMCMRVYSCNIYAFLWVCVCVCIYIYIYIAYDIYIYTYIYIYIYDSRVATSTMTCLKEKNGAWDAESKKQNPSDSATTRGPWWWQLSKFTHRLPHDCVRRHVWKFGRYVALYQPWKTRQLFE